MLQCVLGARAPAGLGWPARLQPSTAEGLPGLLLLVGDKPVFTLLAADLDPEDHLSLHQAGERSRLTQPRRRGPRRGQPRTAAPPARLAPPAPHSV